MGEEQFQLKVPESFIGKSKETKDVEYAQTEYGEESVINVTKIEGD